MLQCKGMVSQRNGLDIRNDDVLESVGKFCYFGDMLNADGGADSAVVARVRCSEGCHPSRLSKEHRSNLKVKSMGTVCMMYGSETWPEGA